MNISKKQFLDLRANNDLAKSTLGKIKPDKTNSIEIRIVKENLKKSEEILDGIAKSWTSTLKSMARKLN